MDFDIPQKKKKRVILNTDAKNEVDDQCHRSRAAHALF